MTTSNGLHRRTAGLERRAYIHHGPSSRVDLSERHLADMLLRRHPDLKHVTPGDCADDDEYRDIRCLLAQAAGDGLEAHRWRRLGPPQDDAAIWAKLHRLRRDRRNGIPSVYARVQANIRRRRAAERAP